MAGSPIRRERFEQVLDEFEVFMEDCKAETRVKDRVVTYLHRTKAAGFDVRQLAISKIGVNDICVGTRNRRDGKVTMCVIFNKSGGDTFTLDILK